MPQPYAWMGFAQTKTAFLLFILAIWVWFERAGLVSLDGQITPFLLAFFDKKRHLAWHSTHQATQTP
jgi:hypothetical protein